MVGTGVGLTSSSNWPVETAAFMEAAAWTAGDCRA
jgi:hypothetical protein